MSVGRLYKIRRACGNYTCGNRVNHFSYQQYNAIAAAMGSPEIQSANKKKIKVPFNDTSVIAAGSSVIVDVVKQIANRSGSPVTVSADNNNRNIVLTFGNQSQAKWVFDNIVNKIPGDFIPENPVITSDGGLRTQKGLYLNVDYNRPDSPEDAPTAAEYGLRTNVPSGSNSGGNEYIGYGTGSSWTTWLLIGGGVLLLVIIVALFLKKKK